jgi:hypothetical protein
MNRFTSPLDHVRVASPCNVDWEQMIGTERSRFCAQCNLNVYNLSSMSRAEAEHLISNTEGRLCVRYYQRADGSILTQDCPVGLRALRRRLSSVSKAVASAVLGFLAGLGLYGITSREHKAQPLMGVTAIRTLPVLTPPPPNITVSMGGVPMLYPRETVGRLVKIDEARPRKRR